MIDQLLPSMRVLSLEMKTKFRGITQREVAIFQGNSGPVEFSPFIEYDDQESARWLQCTVEAANKSDFPIHRTTVKLNGTIPESNDPAIIEALTKSFGDVNTFKVKVGSDVEANISRLQCVRSLRPDAKLRIDVNGTWTVDQAYDQLTTIERNLGEIEYVEQPCNTIEELEALKVKIGTSVKIAADEVIRKAADPFAVDISRAADVLVLKVQPLGGIKRSLALAEHHQKPVVVSSALESEVGLNYGIRLAQAIEILDFDCGLATGNLFTGEVEPVSAERFEWWKNRVMRVSRLIA